MKIIDLSYDIEQGMPKYPSDEDPQLYQDKFLQEDKYNNFKFVSGTHIGTHIDSPMHLTQSPKFIGEYKLENFCGKACIFDVRNKDKIVFEQYYADFISKYDIVLLYTGYDKFYGTEEYYNRHPIIDISFAEFVVSSNIKMVGFDMPSPDRYPFEIHKYLFSNNVFIIENLRNLALLLSSENIDFFAFPLKLKADASWVRAVAKI